MDVTANRTATELTDHRCASPIGTVQRHYRLEPEFSSARGGFSSVVIAPGSKGVFVFAADQDGEIDDYFSTIADVPGVRDPEAALSRLGYTVRSVV